MALRPDGYEPIASKLIAHTVRRLVGRAGYTAQDRRDLEQELHARLLPRLAQYKPGVASLATFLTLLIERGASDLLRSRRARKRRDDVVVPTQDPPDPTSVGHGANRDLALDLAAFRDQLPPNLREAWDHLLGQSVSDAARDLGLPRSTLQRRMEQLRRHCERRGLDVYLETPR